jgi:hypothetical protein
MRPGPGDATDMKMAPDTSTATLRAWCEVHTRTARSYTPRARHGT